MKKYSFFLLALFAFTANILASEIQKSDKLTIGFDLGPPAIVNPHLAYNVKNWKLQTSVGVWKDTRLVGFELTVHRFLKNNHALFISYGESQQGWFSKDESKFIASGYSYFWKFLIFQAGYVRFTDGHTLPKDGMYLSVGCDFSL